MTERSSFTREQKELYVRYLEENRDFVTQKFNPSYTKKDRRRQWNELADALNSCQGAPQKDTLKWQACFKDWKNNIRKKARGIQSHARGTGGGPPKNDTLNDLEEKLLTLLGRTVIDGLPGVDECGFPNKGVDVHHGTSSSLKETDPATSEASDNEFLQQSYTQSTPNDFNARPHVSHTSSSSRSKRSLGDSMGSETTKKKLKTTNDMIEELLDANKRDESWKKNILEELRKISKSLAIIADSECKAKEAEIDFDEDLVCETSFENDDDATSSNTC